MCLVGNSCASMSLVKNVEIRQHKLCQLDSVCYNCSLLVEKQLLQERSKRKAAENKHNNLETQMLIGLAHDRIIYLGMVYIERGYITQDEYENLYEYLYKPYEKLGGNGSAKRIMTEVDQLAIHKSTYNA